MELTVYNSNQKVLQDFFSQQAVYDSTTKTATITQKKIIKEKTLIITFNNGNQIEQITVSNLAEKRGSQTKEQLLNQRILEGKGHILLQDHGNNRIIRVSNIISVDTKWQTVAI